jgi:uncharacterized repeat protein (TIGR01451 family)
LSPAPSTNGGIPNSYVMGQKVTATYRCTDDRSGVVKCGSSTYAPGTTLDTGNISSTVDTSKVGPATFTVNAVDAAGNVATSSVSYQVVGPPVHLFIFNAALPKVKQYSPLTYAITVTNLSKETASAVTITDPLPTGVTFQGAQAQQCILSNGRCSNPASCSFANNTVSCTTPSVGLFTPIVVQIFVSVQAAPGTKIANTATVSSANAEGSPGNTQSTAITVVH